MNLRLLLTATALTTGVIWPASAQENQDDEVFEEIVVTGVRGSLNRALNQKRNAANIVDAISSEDIGDFPDLNIGEALQRISGVTLTRSGSGEGQQVNVRGLPGNFVRTTLNGITAASATGSGLGRNFDFDIFASELFTNVSVSKTPVASETEGGVSATIDLRTPRPFDLDEFTLLASASGQIAELGGAGGNNFNDINPRFTGLVSWTNDDRTFGATLSIAYTESSIRGDIAQSFRFQNAGGAFLNRFLDGADGVVGLNPATGLNDDPTDADLAALGATINGQQSTVAALQDLAANGFAPTLPRVGPEVFDRERVGITSSFQFKPQDNLTFSLDALYATFDDAILRPTLDGLTGFGRNNQTPLALTVAGGDSIVGGTLANVSQRQETVQELFDTEFFHVTFDTEWEFSDNTTITSRIGYSDAQEDELRLTYLADFFGEFNFDFGSNLEFPQFNGTGFNPLSAASFDPIQLRIRPRDRSSDEFQAQIDVERRFDTVLSSVKFGARYGDSSVSQLQAEDRPSLSGANIDGLLVPLTVDGFLSSAPSGTPTDYLIFDPDAARAALVSQNAIDNATVNPQASFTVEEKTYAAYVETNWEFDDFLFVNLGARIVTTDQTSIGTTAGGAVNGTSVSNQYTDFLPSLNARLLLDDDVILRFSANRAIARPNLTDLNPGVSLNPTLQTGSGGNPLLDPFRASQYDIGLEWYFAPESLIAITAFYKNIASFISNDTETQIAGPTTLVNDDGVNVTGLPFIISLPVNGDGGEVYGLELSYQQPFSFLPAPFDGLGVLANATIAESEVGLPVAGAILTGDLNGLSNFSSNVVGYYEKAGFSLRVAWSYRDDFRFGFDFSDPQLEIIRDGRSQIDLSASYEIMEGLSATFDAVNLNGADNFDLNVGPAGGPLNRTFQDQGAVYTFGVRAKF